MRGFWPVISLLALASCAMVGRPATANGGFRVFFAERSAALDPPAMAVVADAAAAANARPGVPVTVIGYTDSGGGKQADVALSQRRAERVAEALAKAGVAAVRLAPEGAGQTGNDPGVESRRVEIVIGR